MPDQEASDQADDGARGDDPQGAIAAENTSPAADLRGVAFGLVRACVDHVLDVEVLFDIDVLFDVERELRRGGLVVAHQLLCSAAALNASRSALLSAMNFSSWANWIFSDFSW